MNKKRVIQVYFVSKNICLTWFKILNKIRLLFFNGTLIAIFLNINNFPGQLFKFFSDLNLIGGGSRKAI